MKSEKLNENNDVLTSVSSESAETESWLLESLLLSRAKRRKRPLNENKLTLTVINDHVYRDKEEIGVIIEDKGVFLCLLYETNRCCYVKGHALKPCKISYSGQINI